MISTETQGTSRVGGPATAQPTPLPNLSGHLHQVDVVRLLTFGAVIGVHAIAFTQSPSNRVWAGVLMLLQFGRQVFFALTGFVLMYSARDQPVRPWPFWRKRLAFVAVPYLTWTLIYVTVGMLFDGRRFSWGALAGDLVTGHAKYHLYFLLVTIQLYLVFPWLWRFVRATASKAGVVLSVVGALNLAWLAVLQYGNAPSGWVAALFTHAYAVLPTYTLYVLVGAYAAVELPRITALFTQRRRGLAAIAVVAAVLAEVAYAAQLESRAPREAAAVLQPAMALSCLAALLLLSLAGCWWAAGRRPGAGLVRRASDLSFGIYLAHPLVLDVLLRNGLGNDGQRLPAVLATVSAFVGTATGAAALSFLARRTALSLALTGRRRLGPRP